MRGDRQQALLAQQRAGQLRPHIAFRCGRVGETGHQRRVELLHLLRQHVYIAARRQRGHLEMFGETAHNVERLPPYRTGAAEEGDAPGEIDHTYNFPSNCAKKYTTITPKIRLSTRSRMPP